MDFRKTGPFLVVRVNAKLVAGINGLKTTVGCGTLDRPDLPIVYLCNSNTQPT